VKNGVLRGEKSKEFGGRNVADRSGKKAASEGVQVPTGQRDLTERAQLEENSILLPEKRGEISGGWCYDGDEGQEMPTSQGEGNRVSSHEKGIYRFRKTTEGYLKSILSCGGGEQTIQLLRSRRERKGNCLEPKR